MRQTLGGNILTKDDTLEHQAQPPDFLDSDGTPSTWLQFYTYRHRLAKLYLGLGTGAALMAMSMWDDQSRGVLNGQSAFALIFFLFPAVFGYTLFCKKTSRAYSTESVPISLERRLKVSSAYAAVSSLIAWIYCSRQDVSLSDEPVCLITFAIIILAPSAALFLKKQQRQETESAKQARKWYRQDSLRNPAPDPIFELVSVPMVRYPLTAGCFWLAYKAFYYFPDKASRYFWSTALALGGIYLSWKVTKVVLLQVRNGVWSILKVLTWVALGAIAIGLFFLVIHAISAMPVSLAIIVGAIIIASAAGNR